VNCLIKRYHKRLKDGWPGGASHHVPTPKYAAVYCDSSRMLFHAHILLLHNDCRLTGLKNPLYSHCIGYRACIIVMHYSTCNSIISHCACNVYKLVLYSGVIGLSE